MKILLTKNRMNNEVEINKLSKPRQVEVNYFFGQTKYLSSKKQNGSESGKRTGK